MALPSDNTENAAQTRRKTEQIIDDHVSCLQRPLKDLVDQLELSKKMLKKATSPHEAYSLRALVGDALSIGLHVYDATYGWLFRRP
jgi:hypothetical protein